jgi:CBS domain containing-hemolysin-like protein
MSDAAPETTPQTMPSKPSAEDPQSRSAPQRSILERFAEWIGLSRKENDVKESIEEILEEDDAETELSAKERLMLRNLLKFGELKVDDLMTPRADIIGVEVSASFDDLLKVFAEAQHSRLPIYRETLDAPLGFVHVKDIISGLVSDSARAAFDLMSVRRDLPFVTPSMPALDLLLKMQASRSHLALVIDEYGGTDGLISIEDLVEQIVGEIDDEHDTDEDPGLTLRPDGGFDADARALIEDLESAADVRLTIDGEPAEMETLGGLIAAIAGRVPQTGEVIPHPSSGLEFEVTDASPRQVKRVRIRRTQPPAAETGAA